LPADRALDRSVALLHEAIMGFIADARRRMAAEPDRPPENFLESMLAAPERYSDREIAGNVQTMLSAGEDTTSHSLAWAVWYLARRPEVQARLSAQARALQGADPVPAYEAVTGLHYGQAVMREAVRLRSAAPVMFVEAAQDADVGGVRVPGGTKLMLLTRLVATQESSYARAWAFDPDRWLDHAAAPDPKSLLAFGAGPRFCPGRNLAFLEGTAALAMVAHAFEITPDPAAPPVQERFGFTMGPSAVQVLLREREPAADVPDAPAASALAP
jgi:cytochrome P450